MSARYPCVTSCTLMSGGREENGDGEIIMARSRKGRSFWSIIQLMEKTREGFTGSRVGITEGFVTILQVDFGEWSRTTKCVSLGGKYARC